MLNVFGIDPIVFAFGQRASFDTVTQAAIEDQLNNIARNNVRKYKIEEIWLILKQNREVVPQLYKYLQDKKLTHQRELALFLVARVADFPQEKAVHLFRMLSAKHKKGGQQISLNRINKWLDQDNPSSLKINDLKLAYPKEDLNSLEVSLARGNLPKTSYLEEHELRNSFDIDHPVRVLKDNPTKCLVEQVRVLDRNMIEDPMKSSLEESFAVRKVIRGNDHEARNECLVHWYLGGPESRRLYKKESKYILRFFGWGWLMGTGKNSSQKQLNVMMEFGDRGDLLHMALATHRRIKGATTYGQKIQMINKHINFVKKVFTEMILGLLFMYERNVAHLDVKEENAVSVKGKTKLMDFGYARHCEKGDFNVPNRKIGTIKYMAPELYASRRYKRVDAKKLDAFAMGVVLWELLAGIPLFEQANIMDDLWMVIKERGMRDIVAAWSDDSPSKLLDKLVEPQAIAVMDRLLVANPRKRCYLDEILKMPWLKSGR